MYRKESLTRSSTVIYKFRRVKGVANFISSGSKKVKRLRRRQYDRAIIKDPRPFFSYILVQIIPYSDK